jgi:hypothetical protein
MPPQPPLDERAIGNLARATIEWRHSIEQQAADGDQEARDVLAHEARQALARWGPLPPPERKPPPPPHPDGLLTLDQIADRLQYHGRDRLRSVRRLILRHGIPHTRRDRRSWLLTTAQLDMLLEALECSPCESAGRSTTAVERSASGGRSGTSKSTLRAAVNAKLRSATSTSSKPRSATRSLTVLPGGREA